MNVNNTKEVKFKVEPDFGGHSPKIIETTNTPWNGIGWYWRCPCGQTGRVGGQSAEATVFLWFKHIYKEAKIPMPRKNNLADQWYKRERAARGQV